MPPARSSRWCCRGSGGERGHPGRRRHREDRRPVDRYDCDVDKAAYNRACEPVQVTLRRGGNTMDVTLVPVDQQAFLSKACIEGSSDACFRDAWLQWDRTHAAPDLFGTACNGGSAEACAYQGLQLSQIPAQVAEAPAVLERACELQSGSGCATLGFLYATGKAVTKDDKRAAALYRKSCEIGDPQGCYNAGLMEESGRGVKQDVARAAADYEEACRLGSSTGCTNLGFLYERGGGGRTDKARAMALYQQGCDGTSCSSSNLGGCVNVGRSYRDGIGVAKDEAKAAEIFRAACERPLNDNDPQAATNSARACSLPGASTSRARASRRTWSTGATFRSSAATGETPSAASTRRSASAPAPTRTPRRPPATSTALASSATAKAATSSPLRTRRAAASRATPEWPRLSRSRPASSASRRPARRRRRRGGGGWEGCWGLSCARVWGGRESARGGPRRDRGGSGERFFEPSGGAGGGRLVL